MTKQRTVQAAILALLLTAFALSESMAQTAMDKKFYEVSKSIALPVIVVQDKSPIRIERFVVAQAENAGQYRTFYSVRNVSGRCIKTYALARMYRDGAGFIGEGELPPRVGRLKVGGYATTVPLNLQPPREIAQREKPHVAFAMITDVWFCDGSQLSFAKELKDLELHLETLANAYR